MGVGSEASRRIFSQERIKSRLQKYFSFFLLQNLQFEKVRIPNIPFTVHKEQKKIMLF